MIKRAEIELLKQHKDTTTIIKIITGVRRCGKSTLLQQYVEYLKKIGIHSNQIILLSLDQPDTYDFTTWKEMLTYVLSKCTNKNLKYYVLIDEVQIIQDWQIAVNSLSKKIFIDIYVTGSNAYLFSNKISTLLTGKIMEIKLFPLSFKDFYDYEIQLVKTQSLNELAKIWKKYLDFGGLPGQLIYEDKQQLQKQYINSVYNDILVKDILNRYTIEHVDEFNRICRFLLKNIGGKKISLRKIVDIGNQENKWSLSPTTVSNYITYLQEALIVNKLDYFSYKNNQELINTSKYFATDHGMRNVLMQEKISGYGRIIENIVYIELLRRNYIVKGLITTNNKEIDFLITKDNMSINLQVCKTLDKDNYDSEIGNFNYLNNRNKCVILCESVSDDIEINNGVIVVNVIDWLLHTSDI